MHCSSAIEYGVTSRGLRSFVSTVKQVATSRNQCASDFAVQSLLVPDVICRLYLQCHMLLLHHPYISTVQCDLFPVIHACLWSICQLFVHVCAVYYYLQSFVQVCYSITVCCYFKLVVHVSYFVYSVICCYFKFLYVLSQRDMLVLPDVSPCLYLQLNISFIINSFFQDFVHFCLQCNMLLLQDIIVCLFLQ